MYTPWFPLIPLTIHLSTTLDPNLEPHHRICCHLNICYLAIYPIFHTPFLSIYGLIAALHIHISYWLIHRIPRAKSCRSFKIVSVFVVVAVSDIPMSLPPISGSLAVGLCMKRTFEWVYAVVIATRYLCRSCFFSFVALEFSLWNVDSPSFKISCF